MSAGEHHSSVWRDPVVWIGALFGAVATGGALFAGRYLPYIDWSNHIGLISVLAHGGDTGALDYMTRSWLPTPYILYYGLAALLAQVMPVPVAAASLLVIAGGLCSLGASVLAHACGRSPRLGLIAPLGMFGVSMGYGFASFVFTTPLLLFALAYGERLLAAVDRGGNREDGRDPRFVAAAALSFILCLTFLGHALIFMVAALLLGARSVLAGVWRFRPGLRGALAHPLWMLLAAAPVIMLALPATFVHIANPWTEEGSGGGATQLAYFVDFSHHLAQIWGHLLERGSSEHVKVMKWSLGLLGLWTALSLVRPHPAKPPKGLGLEFYATALLLLFLVGPNSIEWPSSLWFLYPRFGVVAAMVIFLLPRCDLRGWIGLPIAALALVLVGWNASINAAHVERFNSWATRYDPVRVAIPPKSRILALTVVPNGDLARLHPAMGSLYFYHLADGASYVAFLFDAAALPVRQKKDVKPRAPFWKTPHIFDPKVHGKDFDFLVLRGKGLVDRARAGGEHTQLRNIDGWHVFQTKDPTPRPSSGD